MKINLIDSNFEQADMKKVYHDCNFTEDFSWDRTLSSDGPIVLTDNHVNEKIDKKYAWLIEPTSISPNIYLDVINNKDQFQKIFTHDRKFLEELSNAVFTQASWSWVSNEDIGLHKKTKLLSIIVSNKRQTFGHNLRHVLISTLGNKMDVFGSGYNKIENKITGLRDYCFQIVVENSKYDYYFTEKLTDCFVTGVIPIYWGCPSIGDFFDTNGILSFNDIKELDDILGDISFTKYQDMFESVKNNFNIVKEYMLPENQIYKYFKEEWKKQKH